MDKTKNNFFSWVACVAVALFFFYEFLQATMLDAISSELIKDLNINAFELANISAFYFYSNIIFLIPAGLILDRVNLKLVICFSIGLSIFGVFLLSIAHSAEIAKVARFLSGISGAFCFLCCLRVVSDRFTFDKIPIAIGLLVTIAFFGGLISHVPLAVLSESYGWRGALQCFSILGVAIGILNFFIQKSSSSFKTSFFCLRKIFKDLACVCANSYTWIGGIYTGLLNLPVILLGSLWSGLYLVEVDQISSVRAAFVSSGIFMGLIIGSPIIGYCAKNENMIKKIMFGGSFLSLLLMIFLMDYSGKSIGVLFMLFLAIGFFSSAQSLGYSIVIKNTQASVSSLASSMTSMIVLGGGTLLKLLFGAMLDLNWDGKITQNVRIYSNSDFHHAMLILPFSFILGLILVVFYKPKAI